MPSSTRLAAPGPWGPVPAHTVLLPLSAGLRRALGRRSSPGLRVAFVTMLVAAWLLAQAVPSALAHDVLLSIDPADGSELDAPPTQVVLTFSDEQLALGAGTAVSVTDEDGQEWADGVPVVAGATVTQTLRTGQTDGEYTVQWRSVASDGHPVTGTSGYRVVGTPVATEPSEPSQPSEPRATTPAATAAPAPEPSATAAPSTSDDAQVETADDGRDAAGFVPLVLAALAAAGVAVAALVASRRRAGRP